MWRRCLLLMRNTTCWVLSRTVLLLKRCQLWEEEATHELVNRFLEQLRRTDFAGTWSAPLYDRRVTSDRRARCCAARYYPDALPAPGRPSHCSGIRFPNYSEPGLLRAAAALHRYWLNTGADGPFTLFAVTYLA